jgi:hypothetical protein
MLSSLSMSKEQRAECAHIPEVGFCVEKNRLLGEFLKGCSRDDGRTEPADAGRHWGNPDFSCFDVLHFAQQKNGEIWVDYARRIPLLRGGVRTWHSHELKENELPIAG